MKQETMTKDEIKLSIIQMDTRELVELNNTYCDVMHFIDDQIFINDEEFFEMCFSGKPMEAARAAVYGEYRYHHEYVMFDGYGNLKTFDKMNYKDLPDILDNITNDIIDNFEQFEHLFS